MPYLYDPYIVHTDKGYYLSGLWSGEVRFTHNPWECRRYQDKRTAVVIGQTLVAHRWCELFCVVEVDDGHI